MRRAYGIAAPTSPLDAYGRVLDMVQQLGAIRAAAQSETHALQLPPEAVAKLVEGREALGCGARSRLEVRMAKTYTTRAARNAAGSAERLYVPLGTGELRPCPGVAHRNPHIDHCGVCAPRWGQVEILHPVDLDAAARQGLLVPCRAIDDDATLARLLADPAVEQVDTRTPGCSFIALRLPKPEVVS